ncbi:nucleotide exchange factor GrpE [candidate division TM6 bacterium RIFCSPHIGHO2_12_FULL_36_22]|nr:MAG: nucleotide exchange factor GrpE [candidate division TM6 bacterium RIFCSPHIGHO2_12_FULL_36_22]
MTKKQDENANKPKETLETSTECNEWKEKFIRASADLENFQRRITKERASWVEQAQADVFIDLLTIVDDFDRALSHHDKEESQESQFMRKGFELIYQALYKLLDKYQIKEIDQVKVFDPEKHEAVTQVDSVEHESGDIVHVLQKGYHINDRVLRASKVAVAK